MNALPTARPLRRALAGVAGGATMAAVLAAAGCASAPAATGAPVPNSAIARLTAMARDAAKADGDPAPAWVTAVLTTHAKALASATPGDLVPGSGHVEVFLITMRGHFVDRRASRPPGAKAPSGSYLSLVIDAKTFRGMDYGIGPKAPPVSPASLGPVTRLAVRGR